MTKKSPKNNWMRSSAFVWKNEKNHDCYSVWIYAFGDISLHQQDTAMFSSTVKRQLTPSEALDFLTNIENENIQDPSKFKLPEDRAAKPPYSHMLPFHFKESVHFQTTSIYMDRLIGPTKKKIARKKAQFKKGLGK